MISPKNIENKISELPHFPDVIVRALALTELSEFNADDFYAIISEDAELSKRLLKLANSPFYEFPRQFDDLKEAISVLGNITFRHALIATGVFMSMPSSNNNTDIPKLWEHSIWTGIGAKIFARSVNVDPHEACTAGLLHDIGKMELDYHFPDEYNMVKRRLREKSYLLVDAEIEVLGVDHCYVGAKIAQHWNLPGYVVNVILQHHLFDNHEPSPLIDVVHVADCVSQGLEIGVSGNTFVPLMNKGAKDRLQIDVKSMDIKCKEILDLSKETRDVFLLE